MKKLLLLLACAFVGLTAQAEKVTEREALQKAQQFMQGKVFKHSGMRRAPQKDGSNAGYYVFNAENDGGFVVVAGDDRLKDILGYSENGSFSMENLPDNVKWLLDYYDEIANAPSDGAQHLSAPDLASRPEVQPLVTTKWDQWAPYNNNCPEIFNQQAPTGCVATAMAQVINYFQWPINEVRSVASYTTNTYEIDVPELPARKIGWYSMTDDEIAWLMRYCGQSVMMDYMPGESGARAVDIAGALVSVFNFSKTTKLVYRSSYSDTQWEELIYNELSVGRPVIYSGDPGNGLGGHSFVLHGYKDGLFCVNWGWSGQCDGYFALTNLSPNEVQHYTENQNAIISIQPASNNDDEASEAALERTVSISKAGTLSTLISNEEKYKIKKLTISGSINGSDILLIHEMASDDGQLSTLDLTDAKIVKGGDPYFSGFTTEDNVVGEFMFMYCSKLQSVILPSTVTTIGDNAFTQCGLTTFTLPKSVTRIGLGIFMRCNSLAVLEVEEGNPVYYSPAGSNAIIERDNARLVAGCISSVIPEGVTTIANQAFSSAISAIKLPESLTTIESNAFDGARLAYLHLPKNVNSIGSNAFSVTHLQSITVDADNIVYDSRNNSKCLIETATNKVVVGSFSAEIPEGIESIGDAAFRYSEITIITLPQSLKEIGEYAFEGTFLRYLEIPASVNSIGKYAFSSLHHLKICKVKWQTPPTINDNVFNSLTSIACLVVPDGTKGKYQAAVGWKSFRTIIEESEYKSSRTVNVATAGTLSTLIPESERYSLENLVLTGTINNDDVQFIRELANEETGNLRFLDMTNARIEGDELGQESLRFSHLLEEIKLPSTLKSIGALAFWEVGIKKIVIPKSVYYLGEDIFYQCDNLASISVEAGNTVFDSREDCNAIIETATNTLRIGCRSTIVPNSVVAIGKNAFSGVNGLTSVDLPDGVTSIGNYAFWADEGLTSVTLSKSVTEVGIGPFVGCTNITSFVIDSENPIYDSRNNCNAIIETATNTLIQGFGTTRIPEGVEAIAPMAFEYQTMTSIEIPASVKEISFAAFRACNNLNTVINHVKKPFPVSPNVFVGESLSTATLFVPFGTKNAYATTSGWGSFPKIVEMEPTGEEMNRHAASVVVKDFGTQYAGMNNEVEVPVYLVGESIDPINSIDYIVTTGNDTYEQHLEVEPITYMMTAEVLIPLKADASVGEKMKTLTITKVNGLDNEAEEKTASGKLITVQRKPKLIPLVEEATGTWCGWCPRGAIGLKLLNKTFHDDVVTVAVHSNDPMDLPGYWLNASSFPSCQINRGEFVDPYYGSSDMPFGLKKDVEAVMRQYTIGEIVVDAEWTDDSQTAIKVSTTTTFVEDVAPSPYQIGYLLLEDKQTGWSQKNYFSGSTINDPNLKPLVDSPSVIEDMKYDYVPVATWQHETGVEGLLPSTIISEVPMNNTYTLDISGNTRIQNKERLVVVALLLNKDTKELVNCAKFKFTPDPDPSVVTAKNYSRLYGDANPAFEYTVEGGALEGTPAISCEATATSPVGTYPIVVSQGTVSYEEVTYVAGTLTIEPASLTISAGTYTKREGEPLPEFTLTYKGFKNNETSAVLTHQPVVTCEATASSAPGEYPVTVCGAQAQNYTISYVDGKLIITELPSYTLTYLIDDTPYKTYLIKEGTPITPEPAPQGDYVSFTWVGEPAVMPGHDVTVIAVYETGIIELMMAEQGQVRIYTPNGKRIDKLQKGMNILVMPDGTTRKVWQ